MYVYKYVCMYVLLLLIWKRINVLVHINMNALIGMENYHQHRLQV